MIKPLSNSLTKIITVRPILLLNLVAISGFIAFASSQIGTWPGIIVGGSAMVILVSGALVVILVRQHEEIKTFVRNKG